MKIFLAPPAWLGMLGGGQLGRFWALAAQRLGYRVAIFDADALAPAHACAHESFTAALEDEEALQRFGTHCAAISIETENIPIAALQLLAPLTRLAPAAQSVAIAQDRILEKRLLSECGAIPARWRGIERAEDWESIARAPEGWFPAILKTARMGYDGRGQVRCADLDAARRAWEQGGCVRSVLEQFLPLASEFSVNLVRDETGATIFLPIAQNRHSGGILVQSIAPAPNIAPALAEKARALTRQVAQRLGHVGAFCIEFFVLRDGTCLANEIAPRPHNSGHWALETCSLSSFDGQLRAMIGAPLPECEQHHPAIMLNLLGDLWPVTADAWREILAVPGAALHLYGKAQARPGRKMGHITLSAASLEQCHENARRCASILGLTNL